jgi:5,10-methylenetetrahydromethanopterin reductase
MVYLVPRTGLALRQEAAARGARAAGRAVPVPVDVALHAFVAEDLGLARDSARTPLAYWLGLPAYNAALARSG